MITWPRKITWLRTTWPAIDDVTGNPTALNHVTHDHVTGGDDVIENPIPYDVLHARESVPRLSQQLQQQQRTAASEQYQDDDDDEYHDHVVAGESPLLLFVTIVVVSSSARWVDFRIRVFYVGDSAVVVAGECDEEDTNDVDHTAGALEMLPIPCTISCSPGVPAILLVNPPTELPAGPSPTVDEPDPDTPEFGGDSQLLPAKSQTHNRQHYHMLPTLSRFFC